MIIREKVYLYRELDSDGAEVGPVREFNLAGLRMHVSFACASYALKDLEYMLALLDAARAKGFRGNPVDLIKWNDARTMIVWNARVRIKEDPKPLA